ncbi:hypothetical protein B0H13DRAFT_2289957 [Mycena leptocephala]|nr:hypothetical protein B0H13DRAFT_2289957 [Mycena leptocephala]
MPISLHTPSLPYRLRPRLTRRQLQHPSPYLPRGLRRCDDPARSPCTTTAVEYTRAFCVHLDGGIEKTRPDFDVHRDEGGEQDGDGHRALAHLGADVGVSGDEQAWMRLPLCAREGGGDVATAPAYTCRWVLRMCMETEVQRRVGTFSPWPSASAPSSPSSSVAGCWLRLQGTATACASGRGCGQWMSSARNVVVEVALQFLRREHMRTCPPAGYDSVRMRARASVEVGWIGSVILLAVPFLWLSESPNLPELFPSSESGFLGPDYSPLRRRALSHSYQTIYLALLEPSVIGLEYRWDY